jgi:hypothetical protein
MRVGFGYDVHPFVSGRPLVLGGINIPYLFGLKGHSDADVLIHAIWTPAGRLRREISEDIFRTPILNTERSRVRFS